MSAAVPPAEYSSLSRGSDSRCPTRGVTFRVMIRRDRVADSRCVVGAPLRPPGDPSAMRVVSGYPPGTSLPLGSFSGPTAPPHEANVYVDLPPFPFGQDIWPHARKSPHVMFLSYVRH